MPNIANKRKVGGFHTKNTGAIFWGESGWFFFHTSRRNHLEMVGGSRAKQTTPNEQLSPTTVPTDSFNHVTRALSAGERRQPPTEHSVVPLLNAVKGRHSTPLQQRLIIWPFLSLSEHTGIENPPQSASSRDRGVEWLMACRDNDMGLLFAITSIDGRRYSENPRLNRCPCTTQDAGDRSSRVVPVIRTATELAFRWGYVDGDVNLTPLRISRRRSSVNGPT